MIIDRIDAQAAAIPQHIALRTDTRALTYAEVAERSSALADHLRQRGVRAGTVVAVSLDGSPELIIALLAILRCRALYFCLDRRLPEERRRMLLRTAACEWLLRSTEADDPADARIDGRLACVVPPQAPSAGERGRSLAELAGAPAAAAIDLCSVYCTSGSTGAPKAVLCSAASVENRFEWLQRVLPFRPDDVAYGRASTSVVMSAWELLSPLMAGVTLFVPGIDDASRPETLLARVATHRITHLGLVPSLAQLLLQQDPAAFAALRGLRLLEIGGEHSPSGLFRRYAEHLPETTLIHRYGSTEQPAVVCRVIRPGDPVGDSVPAGCPIDGVRAAILDDAFAPVPPGAIGVLHTGGAGLAAGYANQPALTESRFLPDPDGAVVGGRLYCTGDLARQDADGQIEILGRRDFTIKLFGHRIEPREVELALMGHAPIREAVVVKSEDPTQPDQLVAWVLVAGPRPAEPTLLDDPALRHHLAAALPAYMVPRIVVSVARLPLLPSGKVDRHVLRAEILPRSGGPAPTDDLASAPSRAGASIVAAAWCSAFGLAGAPAGSDFFELGGDSLSALRVVSRLREALGTDVPVRLLFDHPLFDDFEREVDALRARRAPRVTTADA